MPLREPIIRVGRDASGEIVAGIVVVLTLLFMHFLVAGLRVSNAGWVF